jgi:hypothetical protein
MKRLAFAAAAFVAIFSSLVGAQAEDGDAVQLSRTSARVGEQQTLTLTVVTPPGATVEIDPGAPAWNGVEVVSVSADVRRDEPGRSVHTIQLVVAPFLVGDIEFAPAVTIVAGAETTPRTLPPATIKVLSSLSPGDNGEISPLRPPVSISGAESPLLRPAVAAGAMLTATTLFLGLLYAARRVARRARLGPPAVPAPMSAADLGGAEALISHDPVDAYRRLATSVRSVLGQRYGFPASALTTLELQRRMEAEGVDRWQARLVSGLLEECDAVVYAGYRPALERREADLTMAREIVEADA